MFAIVIDRHFSTFLTLSIVPMPNHARHSPCEEFVFEFVFSDFVVCAVDTRLTARLIHVTQSIVQCNRRKEKNQRDGAGHTNTVCLHLANSYLIASSDHCGISLFSVRGINKF